MGILPPQNNLEILIRCDGSAQLGLGHIVRCLALACELRDSHGTQIGFATMRSDVAEALITQENFPIFVKPNDFEEAQWIDALIRDHTPKGVVLDIRTQLAASVLHRWRKDGITVAVIDDPSDRRQASDLAFYPPVPQMINADWSAFTGKAFVGWDYLLLRREFAIRRNPPQNSIPSILVTMGGSDPAGLTLLALKALCQAPTPFYARVVLGRAFLHDQALEQLRPSLPDKFEFLRDVSDMPSLMAGTDLAVAAFGGTAYELAALNVPAVLLGLTQDHAHSADALADAGMAISLGDYRQLSEQHLVEVVTQLLNAPRLRERMQKACELVDGKGVERISSQIVASLQNTIDKTDNDSAQQEAL